MLCMAQSIVSMESKATISSINRNSYRRIVPARVEKANKPCSSRVEARVASAVVVHSLYHQAQRGRRPFSNSHLHIRRSKSTRNLKQVNNETRLKWTKLSISQVSSLTQQITPCSKTSPARLTMRWPRPSRPFITIKAHIKIHHRACISKV